MRNTKIRVACAHDSQSGQKGYIDAEEFVEGRSIQTGRVAINYRINVNRYVVKKYSIVVSHEQAATCSKIGYVCDFRLRMRAYVVA